MRPYEELLKARAREIKSHLALITELNGAAIARHGLGKIRRVEAEHVEILKSGFLVHLYNVVEAVMDQISVEVASSTKRYPPASWSDAVRTEWIRARAGIERDLQSDKRLSRTKMILDETIQGAVGVTFRIAFGGNWSNDEIEKLSERLGCQLNIDEKVLNRACAVPFQDQFAPMKYVRHKRNLLSHGVDTFSSGAIQLSPDDLERLRVPVIDYMTAVAASYNAFLESELFLQENVAA